MCSRCVLLFAPLASVAATAILLAGAANAQPQRVQQENLRLYLDTLPVADVPDPGHRAQHLIPMRAAFRYLGEDISYAYLVGVSGEAFRFVCEPTRFFPTCFYCTEDVWENACQALGYESELIWEIGAGDAIDRIRTELAAGHVVLTCGIPGITWHEQAWCAVAGTDEGEAELLLRTCRERTDPTEWSHEPEKFDPDTGYLLVPVPQEDWYTAMVGPYFFPRCGLFIIGDKAEKPDRRQVVLESLERAVRFANESDIRLEDSPEIMSMVAAAPQPIRWWASVPGDPANVVISAGFAAYERWIRFLGEAPRPGALHDGVMILHEDILCRLQEVRPLAAAYLREVAPLFGADAQASMERAAQHYDQMVARLPNLWEAVTAKDEASERYQREHPQKWGEWPWVYTGLTSPASRARMAEELQRCLEDERAAIAEIENALAAEAAD